MLHTFCFDVTSKNVMPRLVFWCHSEPVLSCDGILLLEQLIQPLLMLLASPVW